ncbi:hypothetical protein [Streptomyces brevispora]|uniref:hypothetical protein n=1 Tax=Streptomyces brevispora TaxID=887462 RepID=UPI003825AB70
MATSESAAAGTESGTPGSPVPRAAAVTALAEEPTSGLFPEQPTAKATAAPSGSGTTATVSAPTSPSTTEEKAGEKAEAKAEEKAEEKPQAETEAETEGNSGAATAPGAAAVAVAPAATAAVAAEPSAAATRTAASGENATTSTATATATATGARRTGVLPLGRPGKPLIAAAVAGGLVLIGVPFLISGLSGSGDDNAPTSALAPAGSRMGPDGSGPGFVPGRQNAPGENIPKPDDKPAGSSGAHGSGTGSGVHEAGAVHEAGTKDTVGHPPKGAGADGGKEAQNAAAEPKGKPATSGAPTGQDSSGETADKPADEPAEDQKQQAAPVTYSHFIGPGCNTPGFATSDQWRDSNRGWRGSTGSQTSYGCSGFYYSVPLSDSTSKSTGYAQWKFPTGSVTKGTCKVSVYIPNVRDISYVGGNPAHYTVHRYFDAKPSTAIDTFEINQTAHLGQWINAGTFPVSTGKISVVLDNRGKTSGNRHAAAAPIKVDCTAS